MTTDDGKLISPWVTRLESLLMPLLERIAEAVAHQHAGVRAHARSLSVGSRTTLQGHSFMVDCYLGERSAAEPDNLGLGIGLGYLTTQPQLLSLDVVWGDPSGYVEADLVTSPIDLTDAVVQRIQDDLPTLAAAFAIAVARGRPPDQNA